MNKFAIKFLAILMLILPSIFAIAQSSSTSKKLPIEYVDPFIGTGSDHGQMDPSATVPFGMVKVGPDCLPPSHVGYNYDNTLISGFSVNRLSGVGCRGAGGNLSIKPELVSTELNIKKGTEEAKPGFYSTELDNGVKVNLTAGSNVAVEQYIFPASSAKNISIDLGKSFAPFIGCEYKIESDREISGWISAQNTCKLGQYKFYFYLTSDDDFVVSEKDQSTILLRFADYASLVELRIGLSGVSLADAKEQHKKQSNNTFAKIKHDAYELWKNKLNCIEVDGDENDMKMFYTSLYRCFLTPVNVMALDGSYLNSKGAIERADNYTYYSSWSLWDTYRTKFPLYTLVAPKDMTNFCKSLVELYKSGKENWSTMHESTPTSRTEHSSIILLDAHNKGTEGINFESIFPQLKAEAEAIELKSPDNYLEAAYDYWALSEIAKIINRMDDYKHYKNLSETTWKKIWIEKFKDIDNQRFDIMHGDGLYEGTLWQYRWAVPFDIEGMSKLVGGKKTLEKQLTYFFENNLYNHGNQPDIHVSYLFNKLGNPQKTQYWVNKIMTKPMTHCYGTHDKYDTPYVNKTYKPEPRAYIPEMDDDDGTMSAWYVHSAMGIYPLTPGQPIYQITSPIFKSVKINLPDGKTFRIVYNKKNAEDYTIKTMTLNGKKVNAFEILHSDIVNGGELILNSF